MSERQGHLYQRSVAAPAVFLLQGAGAAGVKVDEVSVFGAPDMLPMLLFSKR